MYFGKRVKKECAAIENAGDEKMRCLAKRGSVRAEKAGRRASRDEIMKEGWRRMYLSQ